MGVQNLYQKMRSKLHLLTTIIVFYMLTSENEACSTLQSSANFSFSVFKRYGLTLSRAHFSDVSCRPSLYDILGLDSSATIQDIRIAYRGLAKQYHPDRSNRKGILCHGFLEILQHNFRTVQGAYEVLKDERLKHEYDKLGIIPNSIVTNFHWFSDKIPTIISVAPIANLDLLRDLNFTAISGPWLLFATNADDTSFERLIPAWDEMCERMYPIFSCARVLLDRENEMRHFFTGSDPCFLFYSTPRTGFELHTIPPNWNSTTFMLDLENRLKQKLLSRRTISNVHRTSGMTSPSLGRISYHLEEWLQINLDVPHILIDSQFGTSDILALGSVFPNAMIGEQEPIPDAIRSIRTPPIAKGTISTDILSQKSMMLYHEAKLIRTFSIPFRQTNSSGSLDEDLGELIKTVSQIRNEGIDIQRFTKMGDENLLQLCTQQGREFLTEYFNENRRLQPPSQALTYCIIYLGNLKQYTHGTQTAQPKAIPRYEDLVDEHLYSAVHRDARLGWLDCAEQDCSYFHETTLNENLDQNPCTSTEGHHWVVMSTRWTGQFCKIRLNCETKLNSSHYEFCVRNSPNVATNEQDSSYRFCSSGMKVHRSEGFRSDALYHRDTIHALQDYECETRSQHTTVSKTGVFGIFNFIYLYFLNTEWNSGWLLILLFCLKKFHSVLSGNYFRAARYSCR